MDSQDTASIHVVNGGQETTVYYDKLFTLAQFEAKYGEDNCTIMLQERERQLYEDKVASIARDVTGEPDWGENVQTALDDWKPCDDRPPTEMEARAQEVLSMSPQAQAVFIRHITAGIAQQAEEKTRIDAEKATEQSQTIEDKFSPPADIGPPVTQPQQEPPAPASFEQLGADADHAAENAKAVGAAEAVQAADIEASGEDLRAPTAFDEGGLEGATEEGPEQTEVGMPPQQTE